jgi:signal transduction histidine kinase
MVRLTVHDDGAGFDPAASVAEGSGAGLANMRDRLDAVAGTVSITSGPGAGTTVAAEVPARSDEPTVPTQRRTG